jgi:hypothetical protein
MTRPMACAGVPVPGWLAWAGSAVVIFHLAAVVCGALATTSGPWLMGDGPRLGPPPRFAQALNSAPLADYLKVIRMPYTYHFASNQPQRWAAYFEVHLKDQAGQEIAVVTVPDASANAWVRHRQGLLARALADDVPLPPPGLEQIAAPGQQVPTVSFWDAADPKVPRLHLRKEPQHLVPRDRQGLQRPSDWASLLVRSYDRHLCRQYGAVSADLVRHARLPIPPDVIGMGSVPPGAFDELIADFGE